MKTQLRSRAATMVTIVLAVVASVTIVVGTAITLTAALEREIGPAQDIAGPLLWFGLACGTVGALVATWNVLPRK